MIFRINFLILFYFFYFITLNAQNSGKDWYFISIKEKNDICLTSLKHEWFHGTKEDCDKYLEDEENIVLKFECDSCIMRDTFFLTM